MICSASNLSSLSPLHQSFFHINWTQAQSSALSRYQVLLFGLHCGGPILQKCCARVLTNLTKAMTRVTRLGLLGHCLLWAVFITEVAKFFGHLFSVERVFFAKNVLGYILGDFFTNSSTCHPGNDL
jgi:hypothetical protein